MKSFRRLYAPLSYMVMVLLFFLLSEMLCGYFVTLDMRSSYDNTPYRREAMMFLLSAQGEGYVDLTEAAQDGTLSGCAVLRYDESYGVYEVIYCDPDVIRISGMEAFDFLSGEKTAAAGVDSGYDIGDTVTVNGTVYPVQGILERHISLAVNTGVFYSYCDLSQVTTQEVYVLTAKDGNKIVGAYEALKELVESKGAEIRGREMSRVRFSDYIDYRRVTVFLLVVLGVFFIKLIFLFARVWLKFKESEIYVLNLLGDMHIERKVRAEYSTIWLSAFLLSLGVFYAVSGRVYYSFVPIVSVALILLLAALFGGCVIFRLRKFKFRAK